MAKLTPHECKSPHLLVTHGYTISYGISLSERPCGQRSQEYFFSFFINMQIVKNIQYYNKYPSGILYSQRLD